MRCLRYTVLTSWDSSSSSAPSASRALSGSVYWSTLALSPPPAQNSGSAHWGPRNTWTWRLLPPVSIHFTLKSAGLNITQVNMWPQHTVQKSICLHIYFFIFLCESVSVWVTLKGIFSFTYLLFALFVAQVNTQISIKSPKEGVIDGVFLVQALFWHLHPDFIGPPRSLSAERK